jgi:MoaA/NifB/PqqE/SkfB family radical SAM enzyme
MKKEVLDIAARHKEMIFPVFTNGIMLTGDRLDHFTDNKNLIPVLSLEGTRNRTNLRRGDGMHGIVEKRINELKNKREFFGLSITLTRKNFEEVMNPEIMKEYHVKGARLFFLVEYVPGSEEDISQCLTGEQKHLLQDRLIQLRRSIPALFVSLPGDEEQYGGCLAAGRAFVHISSDGRLEPCPFAPYSDTDLKYVSLKDGLKSRFLSTIRNNHQQLTESKGGCALWENRYWVECQLENTYEQTA